MLINTTNTITTSNKITANSLQVDNVNVIGSTIGHSANTSLMTLSGTKLTVDGTIEANSLTLSNTPVTATAEDLNKLGDITVSADKINYLSDVNVMYKHKLIIV